jgi:hypothetical protein
MPENNPPSQRLLIVSSLESFRIQLSSSQMGRLIDLLQESDASGRLAVWLSAQSTDPLMLAFP